VTLSSGDSLRVTYTNCVENGITYNGTQTDAYSGVSGRALTNTAFTATVTRTINWTTSDAASGSATENTVVRHVITVGSDNSLNVVATPSTFSVNFTAVAVGAVNFTYTSFSGSLTYTGSTLTPTTYTKSGSFKITGASNSANKISAPFSTTELDTNGDGIYETTVAATASTWANLLTP